MSLCQEEKRCGDRSHCPHCSFLDEDTADRVRSCRQFLGMVPEPQCTLSRTLRSCGCPSNTRVWYHSEGCSRRGASARGTYPTCGDLGWAEKTHTAPSLHPGPPSAGRGLNNLPVEVPLEEPRAEARGQLGQQGRPSITRDQHLKNSALDTDI